MPGPDCREVAERVGRDELDSLGFRDRVLTRLHLFWCRHCRTYARQLRAIGRLARRRYGGDAADEASLSRLEDRVTADLRAGTSDSDEGRHRGPPAPPSASSPD